MKVREMLTEVLLEVTDLEVSAIANSVFKTEQRKAAKGIYACHS